MNNLCTQTLFLSCCSLKKSSSFRSKLLNHQQFLQDSLLDDLCPSSRRDADFERDTWTDKFWWSSPQGAASRLLTTPEFLWIFRNVPVVKSRVDWCGWWFMYYIYNMYRWSIYAFVWTMVNWNWPNFSWISSHTRMCYKGSPIPGEGVEHSWVAEELKRMKKKVRDGVEPQHDIAA